MDVKIKDRKQEVEFLRMALAIAEMGFSYEHADLINRVVNESRKKKGKFSLLDGSKLLYKWKTDWRNYFDEQKELEVLSKPN